MAEFRWDLCAVQLYEVHDVMRKTSMKTQPWPKTLAHFRMDQSLIIRQFWAARVAEFREEALVSSRLVPSNDLLHYTRDTSKALISIIFYLMCYIHFNALEWTTMTRENYQSAGNHNKLRIIIFDR